MNTFWLQKFSDNYNYHDYCIVILRQPFLRQCNGYNEKHHLKFQIPSDYACSSGLVSYSITLGLSLTKTPKNNDKGISEQKKV